MAHYGYNSFDYNTGEYDWTPYYTTNYDVVPFQPSFTYSSPDFHKPELIEYYPNTYNNRYDSSQVEINYSTYTFSDPKVSSYLSSQTQYLISYSTSEFNLPEFVEYDPTPYDGGYDLTSTYGKPLPPSDDICYPRSTQTSDDLSLDSFSFGSIPSPYGKEGRIDDSIEKPVIETKPADVSEGGPQSDGEGVLVGPIEESNQGEEREGYTYPDYDYGYPWSVYDNGYGNGRSGWCEDECEKDLHQTTYGYGSDTLDLCESLFGYWPCLSKKTPRRDEHNQGFGNPWNGTADYLFGSPVIGYEGRYNMNCSHGNGSYYYQQPPTYFEK